MAISWGSITKLANAPLTFGKDIVHAGESLGNAIVHHPVQAAIIGGGTAAVAAAVFFTGGVDAAAAPAEEAAVIGAGDAAAAGGSALVDAGAGSAVGGDAAVAEGAGIGSRILSGIGYVAKTVGKGALQGLRYALPIGIAGFGVGEGLTLASSGIANLESSFLTGKLTYNYSTGYAGLPTPYPTGGTTGSSGGASTSGSTGGLLSSLTSSPFLAVIVLAGGAFVLYEIVKRK